MIGFLITAAILAAIVVVHEVGHYLAGLAIGIPAGSMRIRLGFPVSEVILQDGREEVDVTGHDAYPALFHRLTRTNRRAFVFVAGGMTVQTLGVAAAALLLPRFGLPERIADRVVSTSAILLLSYVLIDLLLTRRQRRPFGDVTLLWRFGRGATLVVVVAATAVHLGLINPLG